MKKNVIVSLSLATVIAMLAACSAGGNEPQPTEETTSPTVETPIESKEQNDVSSETQASTPLNAATVGDYYVEIKSASLSTDYEGNPAIIITYSWTNNSEDTTSAMTSVSCSAFQDGVGLETAIILDDAYDAGSSMTEVRPGTTIDVQSAFVLLDETSVVEIEVGEWITFESDPPIAYMEFDPAAL